jgi:hypothetical protein
MYEMLFYLYFLRETFALEYSENAGFGIFGFKFFRGRPPVPPPGGGGNPPQAPTPLLFRDSASSLRLQDN